MTAPSRSDVEQELKISLSVEDLERVFKVFSSDVAKGDITHKYLPRAYFDTPDLQMHEKGISLRVQYKPGKKGKLGSHEQTVKFDLPPDAGRVEGALYRKECKDGLPSAQPDLAAISDADAKQRIEPFKNKSLKHIFTAAIERRYFNIEAGKGKEWGEVELAFDVGDISLPDRGDSQKFAEIEIEIKKGSAQAIHQVRDRILAIAPSAKIQTDDKSAQGAKLYRAVQGRPAGVTP